MAPLGQQLPQVVGKVHEGRLLDRLPAIATSAPSVEYIQHTSTTRAPTVVAEGGLKPELVVFVTTRVPCTLIKLAAHVAASYEGLEDFPSFQSYIMTELTAEIIDVENDELLNGSGAGHITGLLQTSGILTHNSAAETPLDAIESSIAQLRTGAALAVANLLVLHPNT